MSFVERLRILRTCPSCGRAYAPGTRFCLPCEDPAADHYEQIVWALHDHEQPEVAYVLHDGPEPRVVTADELAALEPIAVPPTPEPVAPTAMPEPGSHLVLRAAVPDFAPRVFMQAPAPEVELRIVAHAEEAQPLAAPDQVPAVIPQPDPEVVDDPSTEPMTHAEPAMPEQAPEPDTLDDVPVEPSRVREELRTIVSDARVLLDDVVRTFRVSLRGRVRWNTPPYPNRQRKAP